jgi:hypothetical protein
MIGLGACITPMRAPLCCSWWLILRRFDIRIEIDLFYSPFPPLLAGLQFAACDEVRHIMAMLTQPLTDFPHRVFLRLLIHEASLAYVRPFRMFISSTPCGMLLYLVLYHREGQKST